MGVKNPIRYRGYYYDTESGFYYLQSRYYDPDVGRFISPDVLAENGNLYVYCLNDPINYCDQNGYLAITITVILAIKVALAMLAVTTVVVTAYVEAETHNIENSLSHLINNLENLWNNIRNTISGSSTVLIPGVQTPNITDDNLLPNHFSASNSNIYFDKVAKRGRPNQKKTGREVIEGKRQKPEWEQRNSTRREKVPKKHTPGRDHRKNFHIIIIDPDLYYIYDGEYYVD